MLDKDKILNIANTGISDARQLAALCGFNYREVKDLLDTDADFADDVKTKASRPAAEAIQALTKQIAKIGTEDIDKDSLKAALDSIKLFSASSVSDETKGNVIQVFFVPVAPSESRIEEKDEAVNGRT